MGGLIESMAAPLLVPGSAGADSLPGTAASEAIYGYGGADTLGGSAGRDSLYGGAGNDLLYYKSGDAMFGGAGQDTVWLNLASRATGVTLNLAAQTGAFQGIEGLSGQLTSHDDRFIAGAYGLGDASISGNLSGGAGSDLLVADYRAATGITSVTVQFYGTEMGVSFANGGARFDAGVRATDFERFVIHGTAGDDTFAMGDFANTVYGGAGEDVLFAGSLGDLLYGGAGADVLVAGAGTDTLSGGAGNDLFTDLTAADLAYGGDGADTAILNYANAAQGVVLGALIGGGLANIETLQGQLTGFDDAFGQIWQPISRDEFGNIGLSGGNGSDSLTLDFANIAQFGYATLGFSGLTGAVVLTASTGLDQYVSDFTSFERFTLLGAAGNDSIVGDALSDRLYGRDGADTLDGSNGGDLLVGGAGNDLLLGDSGLDFLTGTDTIYGDAGDDTALGDAGRDLIYGGLGTDWLDGGLGLDTVYGDAGNDAISGGGSSDLLFGGSGADTVYGNAGRDTLSGGQGSDTLSGGSGLDQFEFDTSTASGHDTILDYAVGELIHFSGPLGHADVTVTGTPAETLISWASGSITLLNITGTVTMQFDADQIV
ncbi:MAG: hypothetical protein ACD_54C01100G0002 [uncultured bacterium]|nr:MAG: hypothetical protein ACD_54C01100G0002 [uncultured bacterium]